MSISAWRMNTGRCGLNHATVTPDDVAITVTAHDRVCQVSRRSTCGDHRFRVSLGHPTNDVQLSYLIAHNVQFYWRPADLCPFQVPGGVASVRRRWGFPRCT